MAVVEVKVAREVPGADIYTVTLRVRRGSGMALAAAFVHADRPVSALQSSDACSQ